MLSSSSMKVSELKTEMDARFDAAAKDVGERFTQVDERFAQVDERFERLERQIADEGTATRRHFDVVAEDLWSHLKSTAEVSAATQRRLADTTSAHRTLVSAVDDHEVRLLALEGKRRSSS